MQAIVPVIAELSDSTEVEVHVCATGDSYPVIENSGLNAELLDALAFASDPASCMRSLFDLHRPDMVISGSSPARAAAPETPEQFAILEARRRGIPSLGILDFWGMYIERFSRDGSTLSEDLLPDRLCVLDQRARTDLLAFGVATDCMSITHSPWLDRLALQASVEMPVPSSPGMKVLLASQPLAQMRHVRHWPYDQYAVFEHLLAAMPEPVQGHCATIRILPHPSEDVAPWGQLQARKGRDDVRVELHHDRAIDVLREVDFLVTSHSTLAYEALYFGTPCVSLRPARDFSMKLWVDDAGLSRVFHDSSSLRKYFHATDPALERRRLLRLKSEMQAKGLFFSDGHATARVINEVIGLLENRAGATR